MRDREADYSSSKSTPTQVELRKLNVKCMQGVTSITLYAVVGITRSCTESNVFAAIRNNTKIYTKTFVNCKGFWSAETRLSPQVFKDFLAE